jgi:CheY-like chemotaxis protein
MARISLSRLIASVKSRLKQRAGSRETEKPVTEKRICGDPPLPVARLTPATGHRVFFCPERMRQRILLIDDDPAVRRMLLRVLDEENYSVRAATSRSEALQVALAESFNLLLLDGDLPGENSADFCAEFTRIHPQAPIIIMARPSEAPSAATRIGVCLEKPLDIEKLLRTVGELLSAAGQPASRNTPASSIRASLEPGWKLKPSAI